MGNNLRHALSTQLDTLHLEELVRSLLWRNTVHDEAALHVVEHAEVLAGPLDRDNVHEAGREGRVGANLVVDLDHALVGDRNHLAAGQRVFQAVTEEDLR